jgi:single-strand DNA-binding protein
MNNVTLLGRLTKDPDVRYTQGEKQMAVARYTLAVDRAGRRQDGQQNADFINCVAFDKAGEFVEKYLKKGNKVAVQGRIQTGSYKDNEGRTIYTTDVVVGAHYFCESKAQAEQKPQVAPMETPAGDGFMSIPDGVEDEGLPFN